MPIKITIHVQAKHCRIDRSLMRKAARAVLEGENVTSAEISLAFVDDATSARINQRFLGHAGPTDVITFPLSAKGELPLIGELVIGIEVTQRTAAERGHSISAELALYVIHGLLHLCGYDDKSPTKRRIMRGKERDYLQTLKLPAIAELT
jgi:probable rRNA maturation factor